MTYKLSFLESAKEEWDTLPKLIQEQLKKKLFRIVEYPHIPKNKSSGSKDCYKIKLRASGYRLVYLVIEERVVVQIVGVGKRENSQIYNLIHQRIK